MSAERDGARRILFVTRTYPPAVGGMEQYCRDLFEELRRREHVELLANGGGRASLPLFLVRALVAVAVRGRRYTHIHFGDALLSPLILVARALTGARLSVTTYGLDVVFPPRLYQWAIPRCLALADEVVCISRATAQECRARGIVRTRVIPCGVDVDTLEGAKRSLADLELALGVELGRIGTGRILFSLSRLVPRKGQEWFVREVMPRLAADTRLWIAGDGPERASIERAIDEHGLGERVVLLGRVSDEERDALYEHADLFVMPNRSIPGDMEGFGITVIEASARGLPVIGARVDGIVDAIRDGETGRLVDEGDARGFASAIDTCELAREAVKACTREHYAWRAIGARYLEIFG